MRLILTPFLALLCCMAYAAISTAYSYSLIEEPARQVCNEFGHKCKEQT